MDASNPTDTGRDPFRFSSEWYALGVVDEAVLERFREVWDRGEDRNPEHYRYGAFKSFLARSRPIRSDVAMRLYELGLADPDSSMGGAMAADVLRLPECPSALLNAALTSPLKHLVRIAQKRLAEESRDPPDESIE